MLLLSLHFYKLLERGRLRRCLSGLNGTLQSALDLHMTAVLVVLACFFIVCDTSRI
jgi:hypothetical protein